MKVSDLTGKDLDMWVAKAMGYGKKVAFTEFGEGYEEEVFFFYPVRDDEDEVIHPAGNRWSPSTNWEQGGPLIERAKISIDTWQRSFDGSQDWAASFSHPVKHPTNPKRDPSHHRMRGKTPLEGKRSIFGAYPTAL